MKKIKLEGNNDLYAIVDDSDYDKVCKYRWYPLFKPFRIYARANLSRKGGKRPGTVMMQWVVMGRKWIDHIDRDGLNNRKSNLRRCTRSQNAMNKKKQINSLSEYKGVSYRPEQDKWRARIMVDGKSISLGSFTTEILAAQAYDKASRIFHKEFARANDTGAL